MDSGAGPGEDVNFLVGGVRSTSGGVGFNAGPGGMVDIPLNGLITAPLPGSPLEPGRFVGDMPAEDDGRMGAARRVPLGDWNIFADGGDECFVGE